MDNEDFPFWSLFVNCEYITLSLILYAYVKKIHVRFMYSTFSYKTESVCTKFYQKFSHKFYSEISIKDCTSLQYTLLDPVYLHNLNATLKDINTVTVFKHTF